MPTMQFARASNQLKCKRNALSYVGQNVGWDDQRVTVTIKALPTTLYSHVGVIARSNSAADTMYVLWLMKDTGGCHLQLYGVVGGTYNMLWDETDPGSGSTVAVGHTITLDITGNVVTAAAGGYTRFTATNSLVGTGPYAGITMDNTVARLDDWSATKSTALDSIPTTPAGPYFSIDPLINVDQHGVQDGFEITYPSPLSGTFKIGVTYNTGSGDPHYFAAVTTAPAPLVYNSGGFNEVVSGSGGIVTELWTGPTSSRTDATLVHTF